MSRSSVKPTTPWPMVSISSVCGSVHRVAGAHLLRCRAAGRRSRPGSVTPVRALQHREDRADRHVDVDVARPVERVVQQQVLAARIGDRDADRAVHLLGGHAGEVAAPAVGLDQDLVGQHVELLLRLALHVRRTGRAEHAAERALADGMADCLDGARDHLQQQPKVGVEPVLAFAADQVMCQGKAGHQFSSDFGDDLAHVARQVIGGNDVSRAPRASPPGGPVANRRQRSIARAMRAATVGLMRSRMSTLSAHSAYPSAPRRWNSASFDVQKERSSANTLFGFAIENPGARSASGRVPPPAVRRGARRPSPAADTTCSSAVAHGSTGGQAAPGPPPCRARNC